MKCRVTSKYVLENCANICCARFGDLQHLLQYHEPFAYVVGIYGWKFDVYYVYGVTICIGYRGMLGKKLKDIEKYEQKAKDATGDRKRVERVLMDFCKLNGGF